MENIYDGWAYHMLSVGYSYAPTMPKHGMVDQPGIYMHLNTGNVEDDADASTRCFQACRWSDRLLNGLGIEHRHAYAWPGDNVYSYLRVRVDGEFGNQADLLGALNLRIGHLNRVYRRLRKLTPYIENLRPEMNPFRRNSYDYHSVVEKFELPWEELMQLSKKRGDEHWERLEALVIKHNGDRAAAFDELNNIPVEGLFG